MTQALRSDARVVDALRDIVDHATAGAVFGSPIVRDGVTLVPVAKVRGGGGGGSGAPDRDPDTGGSGLGLSAKPMGVYVIRDTKVTWRPALDVNRVILGGQIVAVAALMVARAIVKSRMRTMI